jgi:alpha-tubulin suppressor-like RCC1 family protein
MDSLAPHHGGGRRRGAFVLVLAAIVAGLTMATAAPAAPPPNRAMSWGYGLWGRLGDGVTRQTERKVGDVSLPSPVCAVGTVGQCPSGPYLNEVSGISAGGSHSLALLSDGTVVSWGENEYGQLGDGTHTGPGTCTLVSGLNEESEITKPCSATPVVVSGLSGVTAVAAGGDHSLALLANGTVMAWGANGNGQLGNGTTENSDVPVAVSGLSGVTAIAAGSGHSVALLSNGTVVAWGANKWGQLGDGTTKDRDVPVAVSGLSGVTAVSAGGAESLALLSDGTARSWGGNGYGLLGDGSTESEFSDLPVAVSGLSGVAALSAGEEDSVAVLSDGAVMSWGHNFIGLLGIGGEAEAEGLAYSDVPLEVCAARINPWYQCKSGPYLSGVSGISAAPDHDMALLGTGAVVGWGQGGDGQLGNGSGGMEAYSYIPVEVSGLSDVKGISGGNDYSLVFGPPAPAVAGVGPSGGPQAGGTTVTIAGTNLAEATAVRFGSSSATSFTVNSATSITAVSPAGTGTVDVTVTAPTGTSSINPADRFSYVPAPTVAGVRPSEGPGTGGTSVTINGSNFTGATAVRFGSSKASGVTIKSASLIIAKSPPGSGTVDVTVTTTGGTSADSVSDQFHYLPAVTKVSPTAGPVGGGTTVTITGVEFTGTTAVRFGVVEAASFTVNSATSITAVSPAEVAGTVDVRVSTPEGTSPTSTKDKFKFTPTVTGVSPNTGPTAGGTTVTVTGTGFALGTKATIFKFEKTNGTSVNCTSTTECTVVSPAHAAGKVHVTATVNKVTSSASAANVFSYS